MCWQGQVGVEIEKRLAGAPVTSSTKLKVGGRCVLIAGDRAIRIWTSEYGSSGSFSTALEIWDLV